MCANKSNQPRKPRRVERPAFTSFAERSELEIHYQQNADQYRRHGVSQAALVAGYEFAKQADNTLSLRDFLRGM